MIADQEAAYREACDFLESPSTTNDRAPVLARTGFGAAKRGGVLRALAEFMLPEVRRIETIIGRDLSHCTRPGIGEGAKNMLYNGAESLR